MYRVFVCIGQEHAPALVGLAALVCAAANLVALVLLNRSGQSVRHRLFWLLAAGFTAGVGIWSTHFVAMLAYDPGFLVTYEVSWTVASLAIAVAFALPAFATARLGRALPTSLGAGGLFGLAISGAHTLGMLGVVIPGRFEWDAVAVIGSDVLSAMLAAGAFEALRRHPGRRARALAAATLFTAIFVLHFVGIGTAVAVPDPTVPAAGWAVSREMLAVAIAALVGLILTLGAAAAWLDARMSAATSEIGRLRELAEAAVEGIAILREGVIVEANRSLSALVGRPASELRGRSFAELLADQGLPSPVACEQGQARRLARLDGTCVPVELHMRAMEVADGPREVVAVRDLREREAADAHIRFLAHHDPLTGLLNRACLDERLAAAIGLASRTGRPFAVLSIDLDRFKAVNDQHGHPVGDELLRLAAARLRSLLRRDGAIVRLGGDEFLVVQAGLTDAAEADGLAGEIVAAMQAPFAVGGRHVEIGASVGIALHPRDGVSAQDLLQAVDVALYRAKARGRGRFVAYQPGFETARRERQALQDRLAHAIERGELALAYRPRVCGRAGTVIGSEAMIRWTDARLGEVAFERFRPAAEEAGLMPRIGAWAIGEACREAAAAREARPVWAGITAAELRDPGLVATVRSALERSGLDPARLEIAIPETAFDQDSGRALAALLRLRALGIRFALDRFGAGSSSLVRLRALSPDSVRLDPSFVEDVVGDRASAAIVQAIVGLGRDLGIAVVADGIARMDQAVLLRAFGCDVLQGPLFGPPLAVPFWPSTRGPVLRPLDGGGVGQSGPRRASPAIRLVVNDRTAGRADLTPGA